MNTRNDPKLVDIDGHSCDNCKFKERASNRYPCNVCDEFDCWEASVKVLLGYIVSCNIQRHWLSARMREHNALESAKNEIIKVLIEYYKYSYTEAQRICNSIYKRIYTEATATREPNYSYILQHLKQVLYQLLGGDEQLCN